VTGSEGQGFTGEGEIEGSVNGDALFEAFMDLLQLGGSQRFQDVKFLTESTFILRRHFLELFEEEGDLAFLAEEAYTELFSHGGIVSFEGFDLRQQASDFI
jgi:hypothetical protein